MDNFESIKRTLPTQFHFRPAAFSHFSFRNKVLNQFPTCLILRLVSKRVRLWLSTLPFRYGAVRLRYTTVLLRCGAVAVHYRSVTVRCGTLPFGYGGVAVRYGMFQIFSQHFYCGAKHKQSEASAEFFLRSLRKLNLSMARVKTNLTPNRSSSSRLLVYFSVALSPLPNFYMLPTEV